jgi:hypothetical protein
MSRRSVRNLIVVILVFGIAVPIFGRSWRRFFIDVGVSAGLAVVTVGGTVGATVATTPVGGAAAACVLGAGEAGGAVVYGISTNDPPDTVNFAQQANEPLMALSCPADPTATPALNAAAAQVVSDLNVLVQTAKDVQDSNDRLAGAQMVGTPNDVANQNMWLNQFITTGQTQVQTFQGDLQTYAQLLQTAQPALYSYTPSLSAVDAMKNQECSGSFPSAEQTAITAWALTAFEISLAQGTFCSISDETILNGPTLSVGQAMSALATQAQSQPVPSPTPTPIPAPSPTPVTAKPNPVSST